MAASAAEGHDRASGAEAPASSLQFGTVKTVPLERPPQILKQLLVIAVLLAMPLCGAETVTLSGHISDPSGRAISGAVVNLYNSSALLRTTPSGADGSFTFANLPPGAYVVDCSAEGFQEQSRRIDTTDRPAALEFQLAVAGLHQEVSVIATDYPQVPTEIAKSVSLISAEEIERRDAVFLSDALSDVPGLQIQQLGGPGRLASYRFRGLLPEDTAVLVDGFQFRDPSDNRGSARPFLSDLLLVGADHVEVLRGAGSTLYGTNAIGGLINVTSSQPHGPAGGYVSFEGGSLGLLQGTAGFGGQSRGQRSTYALDLAHINYTRGEDGHDDYRISSGVGRTTLQLTPQLSLFAKFAMSDSFAFLNQDPIPVPNLPPLPAGQLVRQAIPYPEPNATFYPQLDDPDYTQGNRSYLGALRLDYQANSNWSQAAGYQSLRTLRHYLDGPGVTPLEASLGYSQLAPSGPSYYDGSLDELFWRNTFEVHQIDSLAVYLGWERTALEQTEFGLTTNAAQRDFSLQLQNQTSLMSGRLNLVLAGRAQYYRLDAPRFSDPTANPYGSVSHVDVPSSYNGDVAMAYLLARSNTKIRVHAGNGFRSPSLYERFGSAGGGFYYGNPQLEPERTIHVDGGIDQLLFADKLEGSATYFFTHYQTIIDFGSTPNDPFGRVFGYLNARGGNARGVELSVSARPSPRLSFTASYTYTNSDQPNATSAGTTRVFGLSDHQFSLDAALRPVSRLSLDWRMYAVSSQDFPLFGATFPFPSGTYRFPGYVLANLTASYVVRQTERSRLRFLVRVDNLLNREYFNGGFLEPKATARAGFRLDF
jgi:vitamin B12 transporter